MTTHIEQFETLVSDLELIDGVTGAIFASMTWSYTLSLANAMIKLRSLSPEKFLNKNIYEEKIKFLEGRINETQSIIDYLVRFANSEYLPNGEKIIKLLGEPRQATDKSIDTLIKDAFELSEEEFDEHQARDKAQQDERAKLQARFIELHRSSLVAEIDYSLNHGGYYDENTLFKPRDIIFMLEKIAGKCEVYEQKRVQQAFYVRREKRIKELAAERKILVDVMNRADKLAARISQEEANTSDESPLEKLAREAA